MDRLEVKPNKVVLVCVILLGLFCIPMVLGNLSQLRHGFRIGPIVWAFVALSIFSLPLLLVRRGLGRSVKIFTEDGLTRNDGIRFSWADLSGVVVQYRRQAGSSLEYHWRTEIHFANGQCAWVIPNKVANFKEVMAYLNALPCDHKEVRV
jgi:hypothetical protein